MARKNISEEEARFMEVVYLHFMDLWKKTPPQMHSALVTAPGVICVNWMTKYWGKDAAIQFLREAIIDLTTESDQQNSEH